MIVPKVIVSVIVSVLAVVTCSPSAEHESMEQLEKRHFRHPSYYHPRHGSYYGGYHGRGRYHHRGRFWHRSADDIEETERKKHGHKKHHKRPGVFGRFFGLPTNVEKPLQEKGVKVDEAKSGHLKKRHFGHWGGGRYRGGWGHRGYYGMPYYYDDPYYYGGYYGGPFWPRSESGQIVEAEKSSNFKKANMLEQNEHSSIKTAATADAPVVEEAPMPIAISKDMYNTGSKSFEESSRHKQQLEEESHRREQVSHQKDYGDDQVDGEDAGDNQDDSQEDDDFKTGTLMARGRRTFAASSMPCF